jgi:hypothetical protein
MTIYYVNTGSGPNSGNGDSLRVAFTKINNNFGEIVDQLSTIEVGSTSTLVSGTYTFALSNTGEVTLNGEPFVSGGGLTGPIWQLTSGSSVVSLASNGYITLANGAQLYDYGSTSSNGYGITDSLGGTYIGYDPADTLGALHMDSYNGKNIRQKYNKN